MSSLGLDPDRVSSIDELGHRKTIIPAEVKGFFRRRRNYVEYFLLLIFLGLPWIEINGHQALWINIAQREFSIFGLKLFAHDAPLIFFIFAITAIGLALVTALWGRVWCGWACPQTVFIDAVYRRIEILIEGNYRVRRQMAEAPMDAKIFTKKIIKWFLFFVVSSLIAHSFVAYFVGARELIGMMQKSPEENTTYFILISSMTLLILFDFGWFREQFCLIVCPYGRFQGLLMDSKSQTVLYDAKRGEPRKGSVPPGQPLGDCVSCRRCVEVCPTGIDIRKGIQMECIGCTACIDACDEIMEKVKKPKGLIRYANLYNTPWNWRRPRVFLYLAMLLVLIIGLVISLSSRKPVDLVVLRSRDSLYQEIVVDGEKLLMNHLRLHIRNQSGVDEEYFISLNDEETKLVSAQNPVSVKTGNDLTHHIFVQFKNEKLGAKGEKKIQLILKLKHQPDYELRKDITLIGPPSP